MFELPGKPFVTVVPGIEVRVTIDETHFIGASIAAFVAALEMLLGYRVHQNSLMQLIVISKRTGEEIVRCKPRSSDFVLD